MYKKFKELSKLVQILLLLIPVVSWFTELFVRLDLYNKKKSTTNLILLILAIIPPTATLFGWIDIVVVLVTGDVLRLD